MQRLSQPLRELQPPLYVAHPCSEPSAILFFIALAAVALPTQSAKRTVTLNIVDHVTESDGTATITLASGRTIAVSAADVLIPPVVASPLASIDDVFKNKCTRDWPTDSVAQFNVNMLV